MYDASAYASTQAVKEVTLGSLVTLETHLSSRMLTIFAAQTRV